MRRSPDKRGLPGIARALASEERAGAVLAAGRNRALIRTSMCGNREVGKRVKLYPYGNGAAGVYRAYRCALCLLQTMVIWNG